MVDLKIDKIIVIIIFLYNIVNIDKHITYNKLLLKLIQIHNISYK